MTEDEAKTKWCPFARSMISIENRGNPLAVASANRFPGDTSGSEKGSLCVASGCMAWRCFPREDGESLLDAIRRHRAEHNSELRVAKDYVEAHPEYRRTSNALPQGYCGRAGKP